VEIDTHTQFTISKDRLGLLRISHFATESSWPDDGADQMNEKDDNIAHPGMVSKSEKTPDFGSIQ
jgi:hypothetical protein